LVFDEIGKIGSRRETLGGRGFVGVMLESFPDTRSIELNIVRADDVSSTIFVIVGMKGEALVFFEEVSKFSTS